jgi:hypothetical protein
MEWRWAFDWASSRQQLAWEWDVGYRGIPRKRKPTGLKLSSSYLSSLPLG